NAVTPLQRGPVREVQIVPKPVGYVISKKITISLIEDPDSDQEWIYSQAHQFNLNGYVKVENKELVIIVSTTSENEYNSFMTLIREKYKDATLDMTSWDAPVKLGFYLNTSEPEGLAEIIEKEPTLKDYFRLEKEN